MNVLYVSKALVIAAYRDKLRALGAYADVTAVIPTRWGNDAVEPIEAETFPIDRRKALLHGHNHLHLYWGMGRSLDGIRPDLVHIDEEPYSAVAFQLTGLCRRRGIPCIVFAWQNLNKRLPFPFPLMRAAVFERVAGAIAGTQGAADVLSRVGYDKPLAVIPQFGVDPRRFCPDIEARAARRAQLSLGEGDYVIGFAGRLVREKGVHLLVTALADLPDSQLVIIGDGPERDRLAQAALRLKVHDRVHLVGRVGSCDLPSWLPAFDVLVLPSLTREGWVEQFGRVVIEAMACGVPVIGSDSGEIPRVIGDAGLIVPEADVRALVRALSDLARSPALRRKLARMGRERVCANYTHDRIASWTFQFYRSLPGVAA